MEEVVPGTDPQKKIIDTLSKNGEFIALIAENVIVVQGNPPELQIKEKWDDFLQTLKTFKDHYDDEIAFLADLKRSFPDQVKVLFAIETKASETLRSAPKFLHNITIFEQSIQNISADKLIEAYQKKHPVSAIPPSQPLLPVKTREEKVREIEQRILENKQAITRLQEDIRAHEKLIAESPTNIEQNEDSKNYIRDQQNKIVRLKKRLEREKINLQHESEEDEGFDDLLFSEERSVEPVIVPPAAPIPPSTTPAPAATAPATGPTKKGVWKRFKDAFSSTKKPATAAKPATPVASSTTPSSAGMADDLEPFEETSKTPPAAQPALLVTSIGAVNFKELLAAKNAVKEINDKLPIGYTLKKNGADNYYLDGPIKILIHTDGRMVAVEEDRNHKDYAERVMNAMFAICVMNFHLGLTFDDFNWQYQIPDDKKEAFNKRKEELNKTFFEKIDAGNVHISSGPTPETRKSDYNVNYFLKKPGVADAIQKAVGTKEYIFDKDKNTLTRTWSNGQTRTLQIEKDGSITGTAIPLHERFKSPSSSDDRAQSKIESRLFDELTAMARFYVTLYLKGGAEALPETLDFRIKIQGTTAQKEKLAKIADRVYGKLMEEFQSKPFMGKKGYYPQAFLDRVLFNGQKIMPESQKRAAPDSPDEEPAAKKPRLNMGKK